MIYLWVVLLEDRAIVVRLLGHRGVLGEPELSILEHQVRNVLVCVVPQRVDPAVTHSVRELRGGGREGGRRSVGKGQC